MANAECGVRNKKRKDQRSGVMGKNVLGYFAAPHAIFFNTIKVLDRLTS